MKITGNTPSPFSRAMRLLAIGAMAPLLSGCVMSFPFPDLTKYLPLAQEDTLSPEEQQRQIEELTRERDGLRARRLQELGRP